MVNNHVAQAVFLGAVCRCAARSLATGGHADGSGAAGGYHRGAGGVLANQNKKRLTGSASLR